MRNKTTGPLPATRMVGAERNSPMADPLEARAGFAEAIVAVKGDFAPEDLVPRFITPPPVNTPPIIVDPLLAEHEMSTFSTNPEGEAVHKVATNWHKVKCPGDCGVPFGCASQWQPDEIARMEAHGPKLPPLNRIVEQDSPDRFAPSVDTMAGRKVEIQFEPLRDKTSAERKGEPIHAGALMYFPDAIAALARLSVAGNNKHNPGEPLHWARGKSMDQMDAAARHMVNPDAIDPETGETELVSAFWRIGAQLQLQQERLLAARGIRPYSGVVPQ